MSETPDGETDQQRKDRARAVLAGLGPCARPGPTAHEFLTITNQVGQHQVAHITFDTTGARVAFYAPQELKDLCERGLAAAEAATPQATPLVTASRMPTGPLPDYTRRPQ